ncbi:MAG TPA: tetratricopeptide repeat protein [Myxococcota bacterium]|nr:tetratricopeptide repeat protein [Myxococcota bacterium]
MRVIALTTLLLILGTAQANSQVVAGNPDALECFRATTLPDTAAATSIASCNAALNARRVTRKERASILVNRGILHNHVGDYTAAIRDFENALELVPNFAEAYINRGNALFYQGKVDAAIEDYSRAIQYESGKLHTAYFNRGLVNEKRKQHELAYADFVRANELKPDWVLAAGRVELYRQHGFDHSN